MPIVNATYVPSTDGHDATRQPPTEVLSQLHDELRSLGVVVEDKSRTGGLFSITPGNASQVAEWAATRDSDVIHEFTKELMQAIIGEVRRPKGLQ